MKNNVKRQLFGIANCDTVKKVRTFLQNNNKDYEFIDFKKQPPSKADIERWKSFMNTWPVNTKGPTYRKIREKFEAATDSQKLQLLIEYNSAIKRPILEENGKVMAIGNDPDFYN